MERDNPNGLPTLVYIGHGIMTPDDTDPTLKLSDSTPVGAKLERYISDSHPTAPVASSGCFDPTHPRDIRHVPPETFMSSILSRLLPAQRRWAMVLRPKPSNRSAREHCRPTSPSISAPSEVVVEALRRNLQSACRPSPCTRIGHHGPGAIQPDDCPPCT